MKKFFGALTISLVCTVSEVPVYAGKLDPKVIFEEQDCGTAILPQQTTKATSLHKEGLEGQGLKAAILDSDFSLDFTEKFKNHIDPAVFSEKLIFDPADKEKVKNVWSDNLKGRIDLLKDQVRRQDVPRDHKFKERIASIEQRIENLEYLLRSRYTYSSKMSHGPMVMETLHLVAPKVQFFPVELGEGAQQGASLEIARGIRKAIQGKVDVINISITMGNYTSEVLEACQEAHLKDIPIIWSAGNSSREGFPAFSDEDRIWETKIENYNYNNKLFNALQGEGMWFAGAVTYENDGEEKVTDFSTLPTQSTLEKTIFTLGDQIPVHGAFPLQLWGCGTSASAPIIAAGYLLLKQFVRDNGYSLSSDEILDIMYSSGRDVIHSFKNSTRTDREVPEEVVYKALDLERAKKAIEEKCITDDTIAYKYVKKLNAAYAVGDLKKVARILSHLPKEKKEVLSWFARGYYWDGVVAPKEIAFKCFKLAADRGHPDSQRRTALAYSQGEGVDENLNHALHYSKMAAEQGVDSAKALVTQIYYWMDDEENALKYGKMIAESASDAQRILGDIYFRKGDYENAYKYYKLLKDGRNYLLGALPCNQFFRVLICTEAPDVIKALKNATEEYNDIMEFLEDKIKK